MTAYYNEFDPQAAEWLRELIRGGHIAHGLVDERSILDVEPDDLRGFTQCHFFAGIGGWSYALRLAGWPDNRPVWTGSPPCQPFSVAGEGKGQSDDRHLAPKFINLVGACRPTMLFGEQVASSAVFGKAATKSRQAAVDAPAWAWWDDLSDRLEATHYAVGASDIPAAGVGAPHIRQRTFFGAYDLRSAASGVAIDHSNGRSASPVAGVYNAEYHTEPRSGAVGLEHSAGDGRIERRTQSEGRGVVGGRSSQRLADADMCGRKPQPDAEREGIFGKAYGETATWQQFGDTCTSAGLRRTNPLDGFWANVDWLFCRDGKWRPVEPGLEPLAHGVSGRVGLLRGYGNAICPWAAKEFIEVFNYVTSTERTLLHV